MRRTIIFLSILIFATPVFAATNKHIELTDGGSLEGEIVSVEEGIYTIETEALGQVRVKDSNVRSIQTPMVVSADGSPSGISLGSEMSSVKSSITSNPEVMQIITGLMTDPQFQEALQDPEIMGAINSGNPQSLITNKKIMSLADNSKVAEIKNKIKK